MTAGRDEKSGEMFPMISTMGMSGLLVTFGHELSEAANRAALAFRAAIERADLQGIEETAASLTSVFLRFDPLHFTHEAILQQARAVLEDRNWYDAELPDGRRRWIVPAAFGGDAAPKLAEAAALAGRSPEDAVAELTERPLRVLTIGFAPGLPYMGFLPDRWNIPRQTTLTDQVPASAVVVAVRQLIIFSTPTPTGWRHIGQTCFRGFRPEDDDPFVLRSGDEVLLEPISTETLARLKSDNATNGGARWEPIK
ncbi:MAG: carboxyltransferase domain-containing protein [Rhodobacteraceae bacterium]|nr:carboxyltransferase domain-containing protein [Paracoccaceae bacterium]